MKSWEGQTISEKKPEYSGFDGIRNGAFVRASFQQYLNCSLPAKIISSLVSG